MQKTDLIDRKALLKVLREEKRECEKDGEEFGGESILYAEAFEDVIDMVKNWPAVDAVPVVHARWGYEHGGYIPYCSICSMPQDVPTNYCSCCGAKMDGGNSDDA